MEKSVFNKKVVHISYADSGGAGKAALRLHKALLEAGYESDFVCLEKSTNNYTRVHQFKSKPNSRLLLIARMFGFAKTIEKRNQEKMTGKGYDYEMYSFPDSSKDILQNDIVKNADIIHFHWVSGFLDWPSFFQHNSKPIVWSLHDMNPFLGGFHYLDDQKRNKNEANFKVIEDYIFSVKSKALANTPPINVVCLSKWLLDISISSPLFKNYPHYLIGNSVPVDIFKTYDKSFCRQVLGLPENKKLILFIAESISNKRKGFTILQNAIDKFVDDDIAFITIGRIKENQFGNSNNKLINLGYINEDRLMALAYAAADIFVIPSLEDNLPNTVLEALCCGTPVVGFEIGGVKELISNNENGILAKSISSDSLKDALMLAIKCPFSNETISKNAIESFRDKVQVTKFVDLYKSFTSKNVS